MFWKVIGGRYWLKNFKNHMEIRDNVTLGGLLRRFQRKHPKVTSFIRKGFICSSLCYIIMILIPGSSLPLQTGIKISMLNVSGLISKIWDDNVFSPSPGSYLLKLNEIILVAMNSQIFDSIFLQKYFQQMHSSVERSQKLLKGGDYLDLLLYSQIIFQNIVRYSNRLLLDPDVKAHFLWLFHLVMAKSSKMKVSSSEDKHIKMFYTLVQYILNFGTKEQAKMCLSEYLQALKGTQRRQQTFRSGIAVKVFQQQQFLSSLKTFYGESQEIDSKQLVLDIFTELDRIYKQKNQEL